MGKNQDDFQNQTQELKAKVSEIAFDMKTLNQRISSLKSDTVSEVLVLTEQKIQDVQKILVEDLRTAFESAIINNQKLLIGKIELEDKKSGMTIKDWVTIVFPTLTTIAALILGYFIWKQQNTTQQINNEKDRTIATQLSITEEFYKRKFNAYEKVNEQMITLLYSLETMPYDPEAKKAVADSLSLLDSASKSQKLYLSEEVSSGLSDVWGNGIACVQGLENNNTLEIDSVRNAVVSVQLKMRNEMDSLNIGNLTREKMQTQIP